MSSRFIVFINYSTYLLLLQVSESQNGLGGYGQNESAAFMTAR